MSDISGTQSSNRNTLLKSRLAARLTLQDSPSVLSQALSSVKRCATHSNNRRRLRESCRSSEIVRKYAPLGQPMEPGPIYEFGRFRLDTAERTLYLDTRPVDIRPKDLEIL